MLLLTPCVYIGEIQLGLTFVEVLQARYSTIMYEDLSKQFGGHALALQGSEDAGVVYF